MAANDIKSAEKTYSSFISMLKISVPVLALITLIVVVLIAE
jgi:Bacterial aa3 type cytochrome c oxidase subunit IV